MVSGKFDVWKGYVAADFFGRGESQEIGWVGQSSLLRGFCSEYRLIVK